MKVPVIIQMHTGENGAAALSMILAYYRKYLPLSAVREKCLTSRNGSTPAQLLQAAEGFGLKGAVRRVGTKNIMWWSAHFGAAMSMSTTPPAARTP